MPKGYMGKWLDVNLTKGKAKIKDMKPSLLKKFIGGRGLGVKLVHKNVPSKINPLNPENIMIFATGPLTGIRGAPCPGRYAVISKSPKTGAITDSQSGGEWGPYLKFAGFDYIIVRGKSPGPVYLWLHDGEAELKDASDLWGREVYKTTDAIKEETHKEAKILCIGTPGEEENSLSAIMNDKYRAAGRGGLASVMGSKNLKAIAVYGDKDVPVADEDAMKAAKEEGVQALQDGDVTKPGGALNSYGTAVLVNIINDHGVFPTRNFQTGVFEEAENISGETMAGEGEGPKEYGILEKKTGCWGCQIECARYTKIKGGPYKGKEGEGPEYETVWSLGADCGVGDLNAVAAANWLCNKYGLDTISTGNTVAFAMEANERGILPKKYTEDLDFELKFGNADAMVKTVEMTGKREGLLGKLLADGAPAAAEKIGRGARKLSMDAKGLELPAYDPRGVKGHGLSYATSNRGGCHLRGYMIAPEIMGIPKKLDRLSGAEDTEKIETLKVFQDLSAVVDSTVNCKFITFAFAQNILADLISAATGWDIDGNELLEIGDRIWTLERRFNAKEGFTRDDDELPQRLLTAPMPEGSSKGHTVELEPMLTKYYKIRGLDADGRPTKEKLRELDLA